ncbi:MAG: 50S ribosomal protein L9 [Candidatus Gastranaerophilaceae bacterium]|jgi:large subunit ribosomal protein L9
MKVILRKDVQSVGEAGDIVEVKNGFARNFLLPTKVAELATDGAVKNRERNLERIKAKAEKLHEEALAKAEKIKALEKLEVTAKAGETGKLFGTVTTKKLTELLQEKMGTEFDRKGISLDRPINQIGEYRLLVKLSSKVSADLIVEVKASEIIKE